MTDLNEKRIDELMEAMTKRGEEIVFTPEETKKSGRSYMIACSQNDEEERAHRANVMKDASRIVVF